MRTARPLTTSTAARRRRGASGSRTRMDMAADRIAPAALPAGTRGPRRVAISARPRRRRRSGVASAWGLEQGERLVQRHIQKRLIAEIDHYLDTATTAMA